MIPIGTNEHHGRHLRPGYKQDVHREFHHDCTFSVGASKLLKGI